MEAFHHKDVCASQRWELFNFAVLRSQKDCEAKVEQGEMDLRVATITINFLLCGRETQNSIIICAFSLWPSQDSLLIEMYDWECLEVFLF